MKKQILLRGMLGFPLGLAMGYLITIFISLTVSDGRYYPCVPELAAVMGNEINAVLLQAVLCGILGAGFGACSVIWQIESWGILKQTGIYFSIISVIMLPTAYVSYWMECFILDGTQPERYIKLLWYFCSHFCNSVDRSICCRQT